jgi:hypothetical protein
MWAWCAVNAQGVRVVEDSGLIMQPGITNNITEYIAAVRALESLPDGWSGLLCSDSLSRWAACAGAGSSHASRRVGPSCGAAIRRLGKITPVLLAGHPTKGRLAAGVSRRNRRPVSEHNVWADKTCKWLAAQYLRGGTNDHHSGNIGQDSIGQEHPGGGAASGVGYVPARLAGAASQGGRARHAGFSRHVETDDNKEIFRPLYQEYGNALRVLHGSGVWAARLLRDYAGQNIVVDDVRYPDELDNLRWQGAGVLHGAP